MTKNEFLSVLESRLSGLPNEDKCKSLEYYSEIIDDRIDDGITEDEAVNAVGGIDEIVSAILSDVSLTKIVKEKVKPTRKMNAWEIALLILGSPLWLSVALALAAAVFSVYVFLLAVIISFYTVTLSLGVSGAAFIIGIIPFAAKSEIAAALLLLGAGLVCAGLAILSFHLSNLIAKAIIALGKVIIVGIKRLFIGKETA